MSNDNLEKEIHESALEKDGKVDMKRRLRKKYELSSEDLNGGTLDKTMGDDEEDDYRIEK